MVLRAVYQKKYGKGCDKKPGYAYRFVKCLLTITVLAMQRCPQGSQHSNP